MTQQHPNPSWWTNEHSSAWERSKEALRRDWEQTKADVSDSGTDLNQDVGDTIKQAAGKEAIPPRNVPNAGDWAEIEPALRYGYGARSHYAGREWNDDLDPRCAKTGTAWVTGAAGSASKTRCGAAGTA